MSLKTPVSFSIDKQVYKFDDKTDNFEPEKFCTYPPPVLEIDEAPTLIIDNGSFQFRAGWESEDKPQLIFKNAFAKNRANKKDRDWYLQVGNDIKDFEAVRWMVRTPFDMDVVVNFSAQETIFDHAFSHLGIDTGNCISHPVIITEALANPQYCRNKMFELLFEGYNIPKITYGPDSLFSLYSNTMEVAPTALIISSSFQVTHVIPVLNGRIARTNCRRLNLGGYNNCAYLSRLMQLKFPKQIGLFTLTRMEEYLQIKTRIFVDYQNEISKWQDEVFSAKNKTYVKDCKFNDDVSDVSENIRLFCALTKALRKLESELYTLEYMITIEKESPELYNNMLVSANLDNTEAVNEEINRLQTEYDVKHADLLKIKDISEDPHITFEDQQSIEILFQPSLVGFEQSGISEIVENVFAGYDSEVQLKLAENVFITGGNTLYPGFTERIKSDIIKLCPFKSTVNVTTANDPILDTWHGEKKWVSNNRTNSEAWLEKAAYDENGKDFAYKLPFSIFENV